MTPSVRKILRIWGFKVKHIPVMMQEVLEGLGLQGVSDDAWRRDGIFWDGTFGQGGHSAAILERLSEQGRLFSTDRDGVAEQFAKDKLADESRFTFIRAALSEAVDRVPDGLTGVLWDLGVSTTQLKDAERGFSFQEAAPLDMRMDHRQPTTAADLVNSMEEKPLADLIYKYGEERFSRRIAARIVAKRKEAPIEDTLTLAELCKFSYPRKHHRIHPATRTFQALRIVVNDELGEIEDTLPKMLEKLAPGGRAVIIAFHSLEDRIVKHLFRDLAKTGDYKLITKKPLVPGDEEIAENPASRSSKLRIIERAIGENAA
jgi:16S rRNA (cytosine1402-N4)-methyltransferase